MKRLKNYFFVSILATLLFNCTFPEPPKVNIPHEPVFEEGEINKTSLELTINEPFDSTIYSSDYITERSWISYYKNGVVKEKGQNVNFNGCGMYGDTLFFYDTSGNLATTKFYENYKPYEDASCHETRTNISIKEYYPKGNLKVTKQIETCYKCEEIRIGSWMFFSKTGELDSTKIYTP